MRTPGVMIVTGAGRGVGRAVALRFAREGWSVGLVGRSRDPLDSIAAEITSHRGIAQFVEADVSDVPAINLAFAAIERDLGPISALICCAGIGLYGEVDNYSIEDWHRTIATNLTGVFVCCQAALPSLVTQKGIIVAIGSGAGKQGYANLAAYSASKFGLMGFMQSLAAEVNAQGVKVCTVVPGSIMTEFGGRSIQEKRELQTGGRKYLEPEDVADAIAFLVSQSDRAWTQELDLWPF